MNADGTIQRVVGPDRTEEKKRKAASPMHSLLEQVFFLAVATVLIRLVLQPWDMGCMSGSS